jgi:non-specific serine/threonine protein kinase
LAIELAAARTNVLSPHQIASRLGERFTLLTAAGRGTPDRHRTLAAAIDWSYDLLSLVEQTLYRRLSVFSGSFAFDAAEVVCAVDEDRTGLGQSDVLDVLQRLIERSLVAVDRSNGNPRFRMFESIRHHARGLLLATAEERSIRNQHLAWFAALADGGYRGMRGREAYEWFAALRGDYDNFRGALAWALESGDDGAGLAIVVHLRRLWLADGTWREGARWASAFLGAATDRPSALRSLAMATHADLQHCVGATTQEIMEELAAAANMARLLDDSSSVGHVALISGFIVADRSGPEEALVLLELAAESLREDPVEGYAIDVSIGWCLFELGRYRAAADHLEPVLARARRKGPEIYFGAASVEYGACIAELGDPDVGLRHCETAIDILRATADRPLLSRGLCRQGEMLTQLGRYAKAAAALNESLAIATTPPNQLLLIDTLVPIIGLCARRSESGLARRLTALCLHELMGAGLQLTPRQQGALRIASAGVHGDVDVEDQDPDPTAQMDALVDAAERLDTWANEAREN